MRWAAGAVGRAEPLRHDTLTAELTRGPVDARTILIKMLIEHDAQVRAFEQLGEQMLTAWKPTSERHLPYAFARCYYPDGDTIPSPPAPVAVKLRVSTSRGAFY